MDIKLELTEYDKVAGSITVEDTTSYGSYVPTGRVWTVYKNGVEVSSASGGDSLTISVEGDYLYVVKMVVTDGDEPYTGAMGIPILLVGEALLIQHRLAYINGGSLCSKKQAEVYLHDALAEMSLGNVAEATISLNKLYAL